MPQPVEHIDLMLTVLDEHRLALADPAWGARLAREELRQHPETVSRFEHDCEAMFFGHAAISELHGQNGQTVRPPAVVGQTAVAIEKSEAIAAKLDRLAVELAGFGYQVERLPFLQGALWYKKASSDAVVPLPPDQRPAGSKTPEPGYPVLTYNNVLTESLSEGRIVFLPQYGWEAVDRAGRDAWQKLGYKVVPVGNFAVSALYGGSLRCCVKVLRRN